MPKLARMFPAFEPRMKSFTAARISPTFLSLTALPTTPSFATWDPSTGFLPWIHGVLRTLPFETAADPFVGSGCVAYLLKAMGKRVIASDFLNFPAVLAAATLANSSHRLDGPAVKNLLAPRRNGPHFIEETFTGIFYDAGRPQVSRPGFGEHRRTGKPASPSRRPSRPDPLLPEKTTARRVHRLRRSFPLR